MDSMPQGRSLAVAPDREAGSRTLQAPRPRGRERGGRELEREDFRARLDGALRDAGTYRVVALRDLVEARFGGNAFAAMRGLERLQAQGLLRVEAARGPRGGEFRVVSLTPEGKARADALARVAGSPQRHWHGQGSSRQAAHDVAVYRACADAAEPIESDGGRVRRVVLDAEFRSLVARRVERVRAAEGERAAKRAKKEIAAELGLPTSRGKVQYPDARIEFEDAEGRSGRVDVEVASGHYRAGTVAAKARAGFAVFSTSSGGGRGLSLPRTSGGGGRGGGRDEGGLVEL